MSKKILVSAGAGESFSRSREIVMNAARTLSRRVGVRSAWDSLNLSRATFYRAQHTSPGQPVERPRPPLALSPDEPQQILAILHSERLGIARPIRSMPNCWMRKPTMATAPASLYQAGIAGYWAQSGGQSWDITKLKEPAKWSYFYLYVILDIYSRCVVGWMVAHRESTALAKRLIETTWRQQNIRPDQLILHADRGSSMSSKGVEQLLADLGVTKTHSRPAVSNDNLYCEAQFKTLK